MREEEEESVNSRAEVMISGWGYTMEIRESPAR